MQVAKDIICQVYAGQKSKKVIDLVLNTFIPGYEPLSLAYTSKPDDEEYIWKTESEMVSFFIDNSGLSQTFYWNKFSDNPDKIMVGAVITEDDKLIMSLTFDGDEETESKYFEKLKDILQSEVGIVSYVNPAIYENGLDFVERYK